MRIFAGIPWRYGVKRQWGNRKRRFSSVFGLHIVGTLGNEANIIIQYYLVPCRLFTDPKYVTLNELDWPFYVIFWRWYVQSLATLKLVVNVDEL